MTNTTLNISSDNTMATAVDGTATVQPNNTFSLVQQFIDCATDSPLFKAVYFSELAKYRKSNPLYEVNKRDYKFTPDKSFNKEMRAAAKYKVAKARGVILVSQNW